MYVLQHCLADASAWAGTTAQLGHSTSCYGLERRAGNDMGACRGGSDLVVVRGRRGNMLLVELELEHSDEHRPAHQICS